MSLNMSIDMLGLLTIMVKPIVLRQSASAILLTGQANAAAHTASAFQISQVHATYTDLAAIGLAQPHHMSHVSVALPAAAGQQ